MLAQLSMMTPVFDIHAWLSASPHMEHLIALADVSSLFDGAGGAIPANFAIKRQNMLYKQKKEQMCDICRWLKTFVCIFRVSRRLKTMWSDYITEISNSCRE